MKRVISVFAFAAAGLVVTVLVTTRPAFATTRYIAQTAGTFSGGTACNGQTTIAPATFNGITNLPGDVDYICGTITASAGAQLLTPQGKGSSGNPVTIRFDTGSILEAPYFAPSPNGGCGGAVCLYNQSYYVIDGQNTGTIQNTDNGTTDTYQHSTEAIEGLNCTNCTVQNLTIANMYVHTSTGDTAVDQTAVRCISFSGKNWLVSGNTMHDAGWCLYNNFNNGDSAEIWGNIIYNIDHGYTLSSQVAGGSSGPFLFHNNTVYAYANWDTTTDVYHHDGVHCFTSVTNGVPAHFTALEIYDNLFKGPIGTDVTSHIFMESSGGTGATPCADTTSQIAIFNNVLFADMAAPEGIIAIGSEGNIALYNNTIISTDSPSDANSVGVFAAYTVNGMKFKNNAVTTFNQLMSVQNVTFTPDYNQYGNGGGNAFHCNGSFFDSTMFSFWQSCIAGDANSSYKASLKLDSNGAPQSGSPLIDAGTNLTSLCSGSLTALCKDYAGNPRPSTGPWTVGAFSTSGPASATNLTGTVQTK